MPFTFMLNLKRRKKGQEWTSSSAEYIRVPSLSCLQTYVALNISWGECLIWSEGEGKEIQGAGFHWLLNHLFQHYHHHQEKKSKSISSNVSYWKHSCISSCKCNKVVSAFWSFCGKCHFVFIFFFFFFLLICFIVLSVLFHYKSRITSNSDLT